MQGRRLRSRCHAAVVALASLALAGCAGTAVSSSDTGALPAPAQRPVEAEYLIRPGDTLTLKFYYHPDHDQDVVVREDGRLLLPLIGEVQAGGLSPTALAETLADRYSANLRNPRVSVSVKASAQNGVFVGGEVARPGVVPYRRGLTALQALMEAGGPKDTARVDQVVFLQRIREDQYHASKLDLSKVLESGQMDADRALGPSDVIFVPKSTIAKMNLFVEQYILRLLPVRPGMSVTGF